jgi:hypothetical protein
MMDLKVLDRIREVWRLELRAPGLPATGRHVEVRHEADASRATYELPTSRRNGNCS